MVTQYCSERHVSTSEISPARTLNVRKADSATRSHAGLTDTAWREVRHGQQPRAIKALTIRYRVICGMNHNPLSLLILGSTLF